ncbi:hypothetical protein [Kitasatospora sp. NPDC057198]|uniref:hypothetical protein n=1 Tax=Kitasatospora sp. NPDC057198 TaxID=3346046 RepID=UPI00363422A1
MRTPEELHLVDWAELRHPDAPDRLRELYDGDREVARRAWGELFHRMLHQGSVYPAAVAAVPYVAHAAVHAAHGRAEALEFLANAGSGGCWTPPSGEPPVSAELPFLLPLLGDADAEVRRQVVRVAYWAAGESRPLAVAALAECFRGDASERVRAEALEVLSRLNGERAGTLRAALADGAPAVRATAALGLLEEAEPPYPAELLDVLIVDGGDADFGMGPCEFFHGVGDTDGRVRELLRGDPATVRAAAASWIAAGDHDRRGSRWAVELGERWPGREGEAAVLLTAALPRQREPHPYARVRAAVERWATHHPDPRAVAEALRMPEPHPEQQAAGSGRGAPGPPGFARPISDAPDPEAEALVARAARSDDPEVHRRALLPYLCGSCPHPHSKAPQVIESLTPGAAARLVPELLGLLHTAPHPRLLRALGGTGLDDPRLAARIVRLTFDDDPALACAAAVAAVRLGVETRSALRMLAAYLEHDCDVLPEIALLGPLGAPLAPRVERHLLDNSATDRSRAAAALWRITGDPARVVPTLAALLRDGLRDPAALETFRRAVAALPPQVRARIEAWACPEDGGAVLYGRTGLADGELLRRARRSMAGEDERARA